MHTLDKSAGRTSRYLGAVKARNFKSRAKRALISAYCFGLMPAWAVVWLFRALRLKRQ